MIVSVLLVIGILSLLVFVHELGHFVTARRAGVIVEEFGFGLPPRIWGIKVKGTIYSLNLFPLGGFVRLKGENSSDKGPGTFASARFRSRVKILLAGVTMNAIVGYLLLLFLATTGLPPIPNFEIDRTGSSFVQPEQVMLLEVSPDSAAQKAGLEKGDIILTGNGQSFSDPEKLKEFTKANAGKAVTFEVQRDGQVSTKTIQLNKGDENGGQLGTLPFQTYLLKYDPIRAAILSAKILVQVSVATLLGFLGIIASLPSLIASVFSSTPGDAAAVGPVGITAILSNILFLGYRYILLVVVSITLSLAVINALPIPALDGGRVMMITLARFGKRELSRKIENWVHGAGFAFLIFLIILITILDVRRFL